MISRAVLRPILRVVLGVVLRVVLRMVLRGGGFKGFVSRVGASDSVMGPKHVMSCKQDAWHH